MGELLNKIKENKYLNYKLNDIINMYNTYKQEEALEELENLIYEINLATIRQKLKIDVQEGNYNNIRKIYKEKDEIYNVLEYINIILLNLAKQKYKYAECIEIVENTKKRLKSNANYDMSIDNMLIKIKEKISA